LDADLGRFPAAPGEQLSADVQPLTEQRSIVTRSRWREAAILRGVVEVAQPVLRSCTALADQTTG